jgi:hypothetical protein
MVARAVVPYFRIVVGAVAIYCKERLEIERRIKWL